jgi:amidohydrolase
MDFLAKAKALKEHTIALRRDFHRHPELGFEEVRTAGIVAENLTALGMDVSTGVGKTGVVGLLEGTSKSPVVLLRFDMDALPIMEENEIDYASEVPGKMHACGHDNHIAVGLTVAQILAEMRDELPGTVKFVFQPAEEGDGGAELMVEEGVLTHPKPDYALAMHVWNEKSMGWYGLTHGPMMAGAHTFRVRVTGKGGHGAIPQLSIDPIAAAAQMITALQTIVSRNVNPLDSAVITVGALHSGTAFNVIPQEAVFEGTIRTFKGEVFDLVEKRFREIVEGIGRSMGCQVEIEIVRATYTVENDPNLAELMAEVVQDIQPGADVDQSYQTMGSEDFSYLTQGVPGCYMLVGSSNSAKGLDFGHHHPRFNVDEDCLPYAVAVMAQGALKVLQKDIKK